MCSGPHAGEEDPIRATLADDSAASKLSPPACGIPGSLPEYRPMFSELKDHFDLPTNALYRERDRMISEGQEVVDLVSGSLHSPELVYPAEALEKALREGMRRSAVYRPDPLGQAVARRAV